MFVLRAHTPPRKSISFVGPLTPCKGPVQCLKEEEEDEDEIVTLTVRTFFAISVKS